jgi:hypothetical protein
MERAMFARVVGCVVILCISALGGACSTQTLPTAPGGVSATATATTASILGSLVNTGGGAIPDVIVMITGGTTATRSDDTGRFGLSRIPTGNLQLQFTAPGINATLTLPEVHPAEMIGLRIMLSGQSAIVQESTREP